MLNEREGQQTYGSIMFLRPFAGILRCAQDERGGLYARRAILNHPTAIFNFSFLIFNSLKRESPHSPKKRWMISKIFDL